MKNNKKTIKNRFTVIICMIWLVFSLTVFNFIQICILNSRIENLEHIEKMASLYCYSEDFYFVGAKMYSDNCKIRYR